MNKKINKPKIDDLAYYLTLFKIEGHTTYRASLHDRKDGFDRQFTNPENKRPKITEMKVLRIGKLKGEVEEVK